MMRTKRLTVLLIMAVGFQLKAHAGSTPDASMGGISGVTVTACQQAPVIDGVLTDACWQTAMAISEFHSLKEPEKKVGQSVRLTYDNAWLYMAVSVTHPCPKALTTDCRERDGNVSSDDSIELFFDPGTAGAAYFHFLVNAANIKAEQRLSKGGEARDRNWDVPWRSATRVTDAGWEAEIALPLATLASYGDLEKMRFNICLNVFDPVIDPQGVKVDTKRSWLVWAPVQNGFHEPNRFGMLRGLNPTGLKMPFLPNMGKVKVGRYDLAGGMIRYPVNLEVRNYSAETGNVCLAVIDKPVTGTESRITTNIFLNGAQRLAVSIMVSVSNLTTRSVEVRLEDAVSGECWQSDGAADTALLTLMNAYPERNYFTTEAEAGIVCELGLPECELADLKVMVKNDAGRTIGGQDRVLPRTRVAVDRKLLKAGAQKLEVQVCRKDGTLLFAKDVETLCRPSKPGGEVKIDQVNRVILKNGEPFFPFGVCFGHTNEAYMKEIADAGHNTLMWW